MGFSNVGLGIVHSMSREEYRKAAIDAVKKLSADVGIPADLKEIVKKEDIPSVENEDLEKIESQLIEQNKEKRAVLEQFAANNDIISQLIDLALLSNNMLKGESLDKFIKRSLELIR